MTYLDIGARFLIPTGEISTSPLADGTYPSEAGYQIWADALMHAGIHP